MNNKEIKPDDVIDAKDLKGNYKNVNGSRNTANNNTSNSSAKKKFKYYKINGENINIEININDDGCETHYYENSKTSKDSKNKNTSFFSSSNFVLILFAVVIGTIFGSPIIIGNLFALSLLIFVLLPIGSILLTLDTLFILITCIPFSPIFALISVILLILFIRSLMD